MLNPALRSGIRAVTAFVILLAVAPSQAAVRHPVRWHIVGVVSGLAQPYTTTSYFPRPLSAGEVVNITFTIDPTVTGNMGATYAWYNAIISAEVSGSDWSVHLRAPLASGQASVANDDPDYGDLLGLNATSSSLPGKTWFNIQTDMRNPGGPSPGIGPWQPFTSLALPKVPPDIGFFPSKIFYFQARRDLAGQQLDGAAYYGQILSIEQVRCDD